MSRERERRRGERQKREKATEREESAKNSILRPSTRPPKKTTRLTRALQHFELRPSHEDAAALASEASTVEEFVSRAHEAAVVAAIAQAQQDAAADADAFLDAAEERGWGAAKGALFGLAASVAAAGAAGADGDGAVGAALALPAASPPPPGLAPGGGGAGAQPLLPARTRLYSRVVAEMNEAAAAGKGFDAVGSFGRAAAEAAASSSANGAVGGAASPATPPPPPPGLRMMWDILSRQASALASPAARALGEAAARKAEGEGGAPAAASAAAEAAAALVLGGRRYLSECFVSHVEATVRRNRAAAALGGSPSREALLRAYLRVKEGRGGGGGGNDAGALQQLALDFDSPGGADTRWQRLYFSLRAGFAEEARAAAVALAGPDAPASVAEAGLLEGAAGAGGARPLSGLDALPCAVEAWLCGGGEDSSTSSSLSSSPAVPAAAASALAAESERTLRAAGVGIGGGGVSAAATGSSSPWLSPAFRARAGVLALLSSDARCAAAVARDGAALFPTIEDFLWFHGGLVRVDASLAAAVAAVPEKAGATEGAAAAAAAAAAAESSVADAYSLPTLQSHISRFGAAHFSAGGRDPFLYAAVLLLSAQPRAAVAFLARDPLARGGSGSGSSSAAGGGRCDAPHLAAALAASRLLEGGGPGDAGASAGAAASPAPLLRAWGRSLASVRFFLVFSFSGFFL